MKKLIVAISFTINAVFFNPALAANSKPQTVSVSPSVGSSAAGETVTFVAAYSDPDGCQNLKEVRILVNSGNLMARCPYAYYDQDTNKLYLRNDAGSQWLGGFAPGSANIIENSYAKLDCRSTSIAFSGTQITARWSVVFKSAFAGKKYILLYALDKSGANSSWIKRGTWTVLPAANHSPEITGITPADGSTYLAGAKITVQASATDQDNDPLEYQFSIGGSIKQAWSGTNTYIWQTTQSDTGSIGIVCEVRDNKTPSVSRSLSLSLINPSAEEALARVAQNYAGIHDFTADMTLTSTLNGEPFGDPQYCRYYFKAPDKEKTETFSDANRATKTDISIINGSNLYLIDPIKLISQTVDLLEETGLDATQFSQMDIYYNQAKFFETHTISRNVVNSELDKMVIALDAIPNQANNLYSRIMLLVDYNLGVLRKTLLYRNSSLIQTIENSDFFHDIQNNTYFPNKISKLRQLKSDKNLIESADFNNFQTNFNLTNEEFNPQEVLKGG